MARPARHGHNPFGALDSLVDEHVGGVLNGARSSPLPLIVGDARVVDGGAGASSAVSASAGTSRRRLDMSPSLGPSDRLPNSLTDSGEHSREGSEEGEEADEPAGPHAEFRQRLWGYLLSNMVRAIDEVYFLCELEGGRREIEDTVRLLERSAADFNALVSRVRSQEIFARSPGVRAISWDVGRTDVRPSPRHAQMIHAIAGRPSADDFDDASVGESNRAGGRAAPAEGGEKEDRGGSPRNSHDAGEGEWQTAGRAKGAGSKAGGGKKGKKGKKGKGKRGGSGTTGRSSVEGDYPRHEEAPGPGDRELSPSLIKRSLTDSNLAAAAVSAAASARGASDAAAAVGGGDETASAASGRAEGDLIARPPIAGIDTSASGSLATPHLSPNRLSAPERLITSWADETELEEEVEAAAEAEKAETTNEAEKVPTTETSGESDESESVPHAWGEKRNWSAILAPLDHYGASAGSHQALASRLMNRGKSPGLHAKLMSPERKKKSAAETAAAMRERHERATSARLQIELQRAARLRAREETAASASEEAERQKAARAAEVEARHRRAEETRSQRRSEVVRKAGEETRKVEEIAFYNSLDVENKKAALRERLSSAEQRRLAQVEERRRAAEAAEAARRVAERRAMREAAEREQLEQKVREKEARRAREAAEREAKERETEARRAARKAEAEQARETKAREATEAALRRRDDMRRRLTAAEDRRREYLNRVRERATGGAGGSSGKEAGGGRVSASGTPGSVGHASDGPVRSPTAGAAPPSSPKSPKSPKSPSRRLDLSGGGSSSSGGGAMMSPTKPRSTPESPSRTKGDSERAAASELARARATRKRAKKLRQRLAAAAGPIAFVDAADVAADVAADAADELTRGRAIVPAGTDAARPRLERLAAAVFRRKPETLAGASRETALALADARLAAAGVRTEDVPDAAAAASAAAVTSGLVRELAAALTAQLAAGPEGASTGALWAARCASLASALEATTAGSSMAAEAMLVENMLSPLVPHLVAGLDGGGDARDDVAGDVAEAGGDAGGGAPPPPSALEPLLAVFTRVVRGTIEPPDAATSTATSAQLTTTSRSARTRAMSADFVELLVAAGVVDALASLFQTHDRPKRVVEPVPAVVVAGLRLLEALLDARAPPPGRELGAPNDGGDSSPGGGSNPGGGDWTDDSASGRLIAALRGTALAGLPSLLTSALLQTEATLRAPVLHDPAAAARALPSNFVPVAAAVLRLLNATARFGPETAQDALSAPDLRVETHHLLSFILALCSSEWDSAAAAGEKAERDRKSGKEVPSPGVSANAGATIEELSELLDQTVLFIGLFALLSSSNQDMLCWGRAPTLMQRLPDLPFEYYSAPEKVAVLFPTLVAVSFGHVTNRRIIANELSLETVLEFVSKERRARLNAEPTAAEAAGLAPHFGFAARFPVALWERAEAYFAPEGGA